MAVLKKNKMQDFALSSQNCDHWVLQLIVAPAQPQGLKRGAPGTLTGFIWPAQPQPGPLHTLAHGPPIQVSLGSAVSVPVVQHHASLQPCFLGGPCKGSSPAVSLVPALFAFGCPLWFITCPVGAVGEPHDQLQLCFWAQSLQDGVQNALTTHRTKIQQKVLKMPNKRTLLFWHGNKIVIF